MHLLNAYLGTNSTDLAINMRHQCMASIADPQAKEQVWQELIDPKSKLSIYERRAKMVGFFCWQQIDLCRPYFDKFYECIADFEQNHIYKYVEVFFECMLPTMEIEDRHIVQLLKIKG